MVDQVHQQWKGLIPIWMIGPLLGRLVQFPFLAITWTVYSSPQCRSSQVQELVFVTHSWLWPSSPVATARYVWFILLAVQLTKPILELQSELVTTAMGIQGPRDLEKDVNRILTILLWFLENLHETEKRINWWIKVKIGGQFTYLYEWASHCLADRCSFHSSPSHGQCTSHHSVGRPRCRSWYLWNTRVCGHQVLLPQRCTSHSCCWQSN